MYLYYGNFKGTIVCLKIATKQLDCCSANNYEKLQPKTEWSGRG